MAEAKILSGRKFKCAFCGGSGIQPRSLKSRCIACRGKGEVEFAGPAVSCLSCKGTGRSPGELKLACIRCKGAGVVEKREAADVLGKRLREITKRLSWTKKEAENKTKEIEKRLKPIKAFIKEVKKETPKYGKPTSGQTQWQKLENNLKKWWESLWEN